MDYKKKFEDFLDKMQGLLDSAKKQGHIIVRVEDIENTFPELKESEDESVRKELINIMNLSYDCGIAITKENRDRYIAWLEKQVEKPQGKTAFEAIKEKPADNANKVEPKFKVGDWVVIAPFEFKDYRPVGKVIDIKFHCDKTGKVTASYIIKGLDGKLIDDGIDPNISEDQLRYWTIKDAKDGDVLVDEDNNIGLYHEEKYGLDDWDWESYIYLGCDNRLYGFSLGGYHTIKNTKPATKEQSDLLFQKMKEKGYEWDAEKKELKKVEFNPNDLIEESYQQQADDLIDMVTEKSAWSEEDDRERKRIIGLLEGWLSTFKETDYAEDCKRGIDWLKSLRPQNRWKPSKEQMEALEHFIVYHNGSTNYAKDLEELRLQLKKLK